MYNGGKGMHVGVSIKWEIYQHCFVFSIYEHLYYVQEIIALTV